MLVYSYGRKQSHRRMIMDRSLKMSLLVGVKIIKGIGDSKIFLLIQLNWLRDVNTV